MIKSHYPNIYVTNSNRINNSKINFKNLFRLYIWEILHLTIRKKNKHVIKLNTELTEAREKLRRAESRSGSSSEDEDNAKDKSGERPSEDAVERMEEKLEAAQADQKNLFLIIFQVYLHVPEDLNIKYKMTPLISINAFSLFIYTAFYHDSF